MLTVTGKVINVTMQGRDTKFQVIQVLSNGTGLAEIYNVNDYDNKCKSKAGEKVENMPVRVRANKYGINYIFAG